MKITVKVKPNAKQETIVAAEDGSLVVSLTVPPVDGKANDALIKLLAKQYGVKKQDVVIRSGLTSRLKVVEISV
ncbi:MAG: hypothetical protein CV045_00225 [Cyanobacteria bacterium M5B4]|nr:MAG: hypothetical protein CV045_00225 [Cyanobacteria bacterium M5B4]